MQGHHYMKEQGTLSNVTAPERWRVGYLDKNLILPTP